MSSPNNKFINKILSKFKDNKILFYITLAVLIIFLVIITSYSTTKKEESVVSQDNYVDNLEKKLENALQNVGDLGNVKVVITVESGNQVVLATNKTTIITEKGTETTETPILVNGKTVVLMEKVPKVTGVLIVVDSSNIVVKTKIQQATTSLLDINLSQIEILTRK